MNLLARILGGQDPERKMSFPLSRKISPPPNQKCKECFSFGVTEALRGGGGTIRAYVSVLLHHALRASHLMVSKKPISSLLVRGRGVEPPRLAALPPQGSVYAISPPARIA